MQDPLVKSAETSALCGGALTTHQKWALFRRKALQLLGGLLMEKNDDGVYVISIGRVSWWIVLKIAIDTWSSGKDITPNHFGILGVLAGYVLGSKVIGLIKARFGQKEEEPAQQKREADGPG